MQKFHVEQSERLLLFSNCLHCFTFLPIMYKGSILSAFSLTLVVCFYYNILVVMKWYLNEILICIFPVINVSNFIYLFATYSCILEKYLFKSLDHLKFWVVFLLLICNSFQYILYELHYLMTCKYFLPFCKSSFFILFQMVSLEVYTPFFKIKNNLRIEGTKAV